MTSALKKIVVKRSGYLEMAPSYLTVRLCVLCMLPLLAQAYLVPASVAGEQLDDFPPWLAASG